MSNKKNKTTKRSMKAADTLLTFIAQTILVIALIEPLLTTNNQIYKGVLGVAMAYVGINLIQFSYRHIIKPSAKAIIENVQ